MHISYRTAEAIDQKKIIDLDLASSDTDLRKYTRQKGDIFLDINEYAKNGGNFWVATFGEKIVGMVGVCFLKDNVAKVKALRVHPDYRKIGVAKKLMNILEDYCMEKNIKEIILGVNSTTGSAIELYKKMEYVKYDEKILSKSMTAFYFKKLLRE